MIVSNVTNDCFIIDDFEKLLADNGKMGDEWQVFVCAPTTKGHIAYYVITNGDPVLIAVQSNAAVCFYWSIPGDMEDSVETWLRDAEVRAWLNPEAIRAAVCNSEPQCKNIEQFANELEAALNQ